MLLCVQEDSILIDLVQKYGEKRWNMVANGLPGRTGKGCSHRCAESPTYLGLRKKQQQQQTAAQPPTTQLLVCCNSPAST
jgi:hypothetical protein